MSDVRIIHGDCRAALRSLPDNSVDSIVCDPPYHLTSGKKGGTGPASVNLDSPAGRARITVGFMGKEWDGTDEHGVAVAFDPVTWREALRVLKPGGHVLAFGGTRTYHKLAYAIDDAGFEVRDMLSWIYGNGFPKGTNKAKIPPEWQGWNTALKPAQEPICLARKPLEGTLWENLQKWGTGALWIDGCRIDLDGELIEVTGKGAMPARHDDGKPREAAPIEPRQPGLGRWPANILHDGSDEALAIFPSKVGAAAPVEGDEPSDASVGRVTGKRARVPGAFHADKGSAARFFYCPKATRAERDEGLDGMPKTVVSVFGGDQDDLTDGKKSTVPRSNFHPTVKPVAVMQWLIRLVTPPGGTTVDLFAGSGSTGKAALIEGVNAILMERDADYVQITVGRNAANATLFDSVTVEKLGDTA